MLLNKLWRFLCSLKLAVIVMSGLTLAMIVATFLESLYDTQTAQYWVYRSPWFFLLLGLLGLLIIAVALDRYPWKMRHGPFLMAHVGIVTLLAGSWITYRHGLDGSIRLEEGRPGSVVETAELFLVVTDQEGNHRIPVRWTPPHSEFKPVDIPKFELKIAKFLAHADPVVSFKPTEGGNESMALPAAQIVVKGGAMRITQEYWLWAGDPAWSRLEAGPAILALASDPETSPGRPSFSMSREKNGTLSWKARSSEGKLKSGTWKKGETIQTGWRGGVEIELKEWIPSAMSSVTYTPSKIQYGSQAPPSAIYLVAGQGGPESEMWLGLGDRAILNARGKDLGVAYFPNRVVVPFSIHLDRFQISYYEGSRDPKEYSSLVRVIDQGKSSEPMTISMNEPLKYRGLTFYQASYENAEPRPTVSILSVNQDPGRWPKYIGSLLIVLGSIWLFWSKKRQRKVAS